MAGTSLARRNKKRPIIRKFSNYIICLKRSLKLQTPPADSKNFGQRARSNGAFRLVVEPYGPERVVIDPTV